MKKNDVLTQSTYLPSVEIRPGDRSLRDPNRRRKRNAHYHATSLWGESSRKVVVGDHLSSKPSGFSGSGGFGMDAV